MIWGKALKGKKYAGGGIQGDDVLDQGNYADPSQDTSASEVSGSTDPSSTSNDNFVGQETGGVGADPSTKAQAIGFALGSNAARSPSSAGNIRDTLQQYLAGNKTDLDKLRDLVQGYQTKKGSESNKTNLAPLLALSDKFFGGNLAKSYTPPTQETDADRQMDQAKAQDLLVKSNQPLTQDLIKEDAIENSAQGKAAATNQRAQAALYKYQKDRQVAGDKGDKQANDQMIKDRDLLFKAQHNVTTDKDLNSSIAKTHDIAKEIDNVQAAKDGNGLATNLNPINMIPTFTGLKRINQIEIQQAMGSSDIPSVLQRWAQKKSDGSMTPKDYDDYMQVLSLAKKAAEGDVAERSSNHIDRYLNVVNKTHPEYTRGQAASDLVLGGGSARNTNQEGGGSTPNGIPQGAKYLQNNKTKEWGWIKDGKQYFPSK